MAPHDSTSARSLYFVRPGVIDVRRERIAGAPGDLLVESELIGISHGTEMLFYRGPFPTGHLLEAHGTIDPARDYPIKYGYINVGRTAADNRRVFAFAPHQDRFYAASSGLIEIPHDIDAPDAIFYASMETALQIVHDTAPAFGERILLCGLGVIGTLVARILRSMRIAVIASDPISARRDRAASAGCAVVDPADPASAQVILEATSGFGVDAAINTSASDAALQLAIDSCAPEGRVIEASWYGEHRSTIDLGVAFHRRRVTVRASQVSCLNPSMQPRWTHERRTELVWQLIREQRPSGLISHRIALDNAADAYVLLADRPHEAMQIVLVP